MVRSVWKVKNIFLRKNLKEKKFLIFNANFKILQDYVGFIFYVYTGNKFKKIVISEEYVGILLSTLVITRYNNGAIHVNKKKLKKKK